LLKAEYHILYEAVGLVLLVSAWPHARLSLYRLRRWSGG
jgi:hypothetical protein